MGVNLSRTERDIQAVKVLLTVKKLTVFAFTLLLLVVNNPPCIGVGERIILVPDDYGTIQAALDVASVLPLMTLSVTYYRFLQQARALAR